MPPSPPLLFVVRAFLSPETCADLRRAMDGGRAEQAAVLGRDQGEIDVRVETRRALDVEVSPDALAAVEARLDEQLPTLAAFFGLPLSFREGAGFVRYEAGAFYAAHQDWSDGEAWPEAARRRIAIVLFLSGAREAEPDGLFDGGLLRVYQDDGVPIDVVPRTGMLAAFPATAWHEVTAVRAGVRDVVVDWAG